MDCWTILCATLSTTIEQNQGESDVDCGGPCDACPVGHGCKDSKDCASMACAQGLCVVPACLDDSACESLDGLCTAGSCDLQQHQGNRHIHRRAHG